MVALANGHLVAVFDVLDDCTRMLVACHAAPAETATAAITAINHAITDHGPPAIVLSDNGAAFTSHRLHDNAGPSRFAQTLHPHGTRLIHSSPYHPQTCGKVERHHQTLKKWLATQPHQPRTLRQLQHLLDTYREHYNHRRHSALTARATPHHACTATRHGGPKPYPSKPTRPSTDPASPPPAPSPPAAPASVSAAPGADTPSPPSATTNTSPSTPPKATPSATPPSPTAPTRASHPPLTHVPGHTLDTPTGT
ncbi:DDE-type integrase/transposase/recombinase [Micromonospora sp. BRA006-A]|nr:DDE-type integrase/transposase/recombinase [Micromonospora sp. BRA006-A]